MIAANLAERHKKFGFTIKLTLLNAFLNGHRFCTSNSTVPFEVATNRMDFNALPAGCRIISCRPLLLELTSSEPLTLDEEVCMQEEWHRDERKCTLVIFARDLLLLDLDIVEDDRPSVAVASPSRIPSPQRRRHRRRSPLPSPRPSPAAVAMCAAAALPPLPRHRHATGTPPPRHRHAAGTPPPPSHCRAAATAGGTYS
jgi:hypothetical protein